MDWDGRVVAWRRGVQGLLVVADWGCEDIDGNRERASAGGGSAGRSEETTRLYEASMAATHCCCLVGFCKCHPDDIVTSCASDL